MTSALLFTQTLSAISLWERDPYEIRQLINDRIMSYEAETPDIFKSEEFILETSRGVTPFRVYIPNNDLNLPIVLMIHGGAWVAGNLDTHDHMARYLCKEARAIVCSVGYLNSPEGKFPYPLEQCYDVFLWIVRHANKFHGDVQRLAVVGDSAGGNMAAAFCLMTRDRMGPKINYQVLINPCPDLSAVGTLQQQGDQLDTQRWNISQYLNQDSDLFNPYASPMLAKDLKNLPSATVILAEKDELREEGQRYADRLIVNGVATQIYVQIGTGHLGGNGARVTSRAKESMDVAASALRNAFYTQTN